MDSGFHCVGIGIVVIISKPDEVDLDLKAHPENINTSEIIYDVREAVADATRIPLNCILPLKNYTDEISSSIPINIQALTVLEKTIQTAEQYYYRVLNSTGEFQHAPVVKSSSSVGSHPTPTITTSASWSTSPSTPATFLQPGILSPNGVTLFVHLGGETTDDLVEICLPADSTLSQLKSAVAEQYNVQEARIETVKRYIQSGGKVAIKTDEQVQRLANESTLEVTLSVK